MSNKKYIASKNGPFFIDGKKYVSLTEVADRFLIPFKTLHKRYERGKRGADLIKNRSIEHEGVTYGNKI